MKLLALLLFFPACTVIQPLPGGGKVVFAPTMCDFKKAKALFSDDRVLDGPDVPFRLVVRR